MRVRGVVAWVAAAALAACGADDPDPQNPGATTIGGGLSGSGTGTGGGSSDDDNDEPLDLPPEMPADETGECDALVEHAEVQPQPQDILIFVDNSSSMSAETGFVQAQLNAFSSQIVDANVDPRIILFSSYPGVAHGICIDPPLGSGGCPGEDNNPPGYIHIDVIMESDALHRLISMYPDYSPHLRPGAATHIVVVTDFDAHFPIPEFVDQFNATAPELADFTFHGIIAPEDPGLACQNGTSCCGFADEHCAQYQELIALTGGVEGNLCDQEFQPIFDALAEQVIGDAELPCAYDLPVEAAGADFDVDEVNVEFDDGAGGLLELGRVDDAAACAGVANGWYYDDPIAPTVIHVCPQTCESIQGFDTATIAVIFGCETIPAS